MSDDNSSPITLDDDPKHKLSTHSDKTLFRLRKDTYSSRQSEDREAVTKRILWSAILPGTFALVVTMGLASALLIWLYVTKISVLPRCNVKVANQSSDCPGSGDLVLFTRVPVNIILTVTKIIDSAQASCAGLIMLLAAFHLARNWQTRDTITLPEFSELLALCISGRLWALGNASMLVWRRRNRKRSALLMKAVAISFSAQLLSHAISFVDIYFHEATVTALTAAGTIDNIPMSKTFGRSVNTSCYNPVLKGSNDYCSTASSALGSFLQHPVEAYQIFSNTSSTERVAQIFGQDPESLSITLDASLLGSEHFNASTVGVSAQCRVATVQCNLVNVPHVINAYNCSAIGYPDVATSESGTGLGNTYIGSFNVAKELYNVTSNSTELTAGMPPGNVTQTLLLIPVQLPMVGPGADDGFAGTANIGSDVDSPEIILYCSLLAHSVHYHYDAGNITIWSTSSLNGNESGVILAPVLVAQLTDTISQTNAVAQAGNSTLYANAFARQLAANALAYGSGGTLTAIPITSDGYSAELQLTTLVPLKALFSFVAVLYLYGIFILVLLILALLSPKDGIAKTVQGKNEGKVANLVRLGQLRLTNPAFIIHQLLGTAVERRKETFSFDLWTKEERDQQVEFSTMAARKSDRREGVGVVKLDSYYDGQ